jgi:Zn-finger nucleic acid-binding protein
MTSSSVVLQCPRCVNARMVEQHWNGVHLHICMGCGANWFQAGELAAWEGWAEDIPEGAERGAGHRLARVHCPQCSSLMEALRFEMEPPVEVRRCLGCHGLLLDFESIRHIPAIAKWSARRRAGEGRTA